MKSLSIKSRLQLEHYPEYDSIKELYYYGNDSPNLGVFSKFKNLEVLGIPSNGLSSLQGIGVFTKLKELHIHNNLITDLSPLKELSDSLEYLSVSYCPIQDPTTIGVLTNLNELYASKIGITDISFLTNLNRLKTLYIGQNEIENLLPFGSLLSLEKVSLDETGERDIKEYDVLKSLPNLKEAILTRNRVNASYAKGLLFKVAL